MFNDEILPNVLLVSVARVRDTSMPRDIIFIKQFKNNIVRAQGRAEEFNKYYFFIYLNDANFYNNFSIINLL